MVSFRIINWEIDNSIPYSKITFSRLTSLSEHWYLNFRKVVRDPLSEIISIQMESRGAAKFKNWGGH